MTRTTLKTDHLAERWNTSVGYLAQLRHRGGGLRYLKLGSKVLYRLEDIEDYEAARLIETVAA